MSLINDALKKAQRERTGTPHSAARLPGGGPRPATEAERPGALRLQMLLLGGGALLGLLIATGAVFLYRRDNPAAATSPQSVASAPSNAVADAAKLEPAKSPAQPPVLEPQTAPASVATTATKASVQPEPELVTIKTSAVESTPLDSAKSASDLATAVASVPPLHATTKFADAVEALRVMGIRASGTDSKVLMNDRVFRIGDVVNHDLGIKLTGVSANSLTFLDATGATYTRHF